MTSMTPTQTAPWKRLAEQVIVERARLSKSKWQPHLKRLIKDIQRYHGILARPGELSDYGLDPRELLIWAWLVLMSAPEGVGQLYAQLLERKEDGKGIEDQAEALREKGYRLDGLQTSPKLQIAWLAALVRAIDADLSQASFWPEPGEPFDAKTWQVTGYPCYIVPVQRGYRLENGKDRARRATYYHAIVPEQYGDYVVDLKLHGEVTASGAPRPWTYGAAILDGMTIDIVTEGDQYFWINGAPLPDDRAIIEEQIEAALEGAVDALLWPELAVPDDRLAIIRGKLAADPLGDPRRVPLVLAGSWHREQQGQRFNRAVLLQSRGLELAHYDKRRIYEVDDRYEDIATGCTIPVVVMEDRLVGIAICKDFCDDCKDDVYDALSLDLVLVTSMGYASTAHAHARNAKRLQSQQGAVTFLVQQVPVPIGAPDRADEPPGYSFALPAGPGASPSPAQNVSFRMLEARR